MGTFAAEEHLATTYDFWAVKVHGSKAEINFKIELYYEEEISKREKV